MKKLLMVLPLVFLLCITFSCQKGEEVAEIMSDQEKEDISRAVEEKLAVYIDAFKQLDIEQMLDFFADTEGFVFVGDGLLIVGYDKYAARLRKVISNFAEVTSFANKKPHVYVLSKDVASWSMEYEWSVTNKEGNTVNAKGSWMYVFKKFDDAWKVIHSAGTHLYE